LGFDGTVEADAGDDVIGSRRLASRNDDDPGASLFFRERSAINGRTGQRRPMAPIAGDAP